MGEWQVRAAYFKTKRDGCGEKNNPWKTVKVSTCCGMRLHRRRTNLWLKGACGRSPALKLMDFTRQEITREKLRIFYFGEVCGDASLHVRLCTSVL